MRFQIQHHTEYFYEETVGFTPQWLRLHPRLDPWIKLKSYHLQVFPSGTIHWIRDADGNAVAKFFTIEQSRQLCVNVDMEVESTQDSPFDFLLDTHAVNLPFEYSAVERQVMGTCFQTPPSNSIVLDWMKECSLEASGETVTFLTHVSQFLHRSIHYQIRDEPGIQTPEETLEKRSGTCRDYAVLFNALCGVWGLASRFVSGYLCAQHDPEHEQGTHALHAWSEVYLPGAGWKGIDPTNGIWCGPHYVPLAASPHPAETAAITGTYCSHHPVQARMTSTLSIKNSDGK